MWTYTTDGFFSVIVDDFCENGEVVVRARVEQDLDNFLDRLVNELDYDDIFEVLEIAHADYRFRVIIDKVAWADYLQLSAMGIEYSAGGFKGTLDPKDKDRHDAYFKVWNAMHQLQTAKERKINGHPKTKAKKSSKVQNSKSLSKMGRQNRNND